MCDSASKFWRYEATELFGENIDKWKLRTEANKMLTVAKLAVRNCADGWILYYGARLLLTDNALKNNPSFAYEMRESVHDSREDWLCQFLYTFSIATLINLPNL